MDGRAAGASGFRAGPPGVRLAGERDGVDRALADDGSAGSDRR